MELFIAIMVVILAVRYLFILIDIFFEAVPNEVIYKINPIQGITVMIVYLSVMIFIVPYLIVLEFNPYLKNRWVEAHKRSINRVFLN